MNAVHLIAFLAIAQAPINDDDWTPRPAKRGAEPWEMQREKDWIDKRFRKMDVGTFLNCSLEYPHGIDAIRVTRATAIKVGDKGESTMIFDRNLMRWAAGWSNGFLELSDRRFGLLNVALPNGQIAFATPAVAGWNSDGRQVSTTRPLPKEQAEFRGMHRAANRVIVALNVQGVSVFESPEYTSWGGFQVFVRNVEIGRTDVAKTFTFAIETINEKATIVAPNPEQSLGSHCIAQKGADDANLVAIVGCDDVSLKFQGDGKSGLLQGVVQSSTEPRVFRILQAVGDRRKLDMFLKLVATLKAGPLSDLTPTATTNADTPRWQTLETRGNVAGADGPLVVDSLTAPHDNPHRALMFLSGFDFLPNGDIAVAAAHGDVWIVSGVDEKLDKLTWRRFATGLYQPLGLKVVDGKIVVIERGQLTRLHDRDGNGETDFYENLCDDWHVGHGPHSFDTCLETDPQGNFYFFKTGDTETPTGGCLMKVPPEGKKAEIFCTGFRHPVGLGMSPTGVVTGADQEGNWMPATRIDLYKRGGFYGDMRAHHRDVPPKAYDPPICWVPHHVDNSAGGQVWVPKGSWGPLSERCLHFSYGRCNAYLLSMEENGGVPQGGLVDLKTQFSSGVMSGRFNPRDGCLYVAGLRGWQNAAKEDGCLQRVRYTGKPFVMPLDVKVRKDGLALSFSQPLDRAIAEDVKNYRVAEWNYRWTADYGSKRYSVKDPKKVGQDDVAVKSAKLLDEKTVLLGVEPLHPVMQMQIGYNVRTQTGQPLVGLIYNTINAVPK